MPTPNPAHKQPSPTADVPDDDRLPVTVTVVGGPTALIEMGGLRLITDPTFDPPGLHSVGERTLVKTVGPALSAAQIGPVDVVLLSHDQHPDNLDTLGRQVVAASPLVLTTASAASRLGGTATHVPAWTTTSLSRPGGRRLRLTGVPAQHGPDGTEHLTGEVTGFVLTGEDLPSLYVSGDNASLDIVRAVAERCGPIDLALLFAGAARTPLLEDYLTLTSEQAATAAILLGSASIIPLHTEGWAHFTQGPDDLAAAYRRAGLGHRLTTLAPGDSTTWPPPLSRRQTA